MKTLLLDIETAPNIGHIWGLRDQTISINQLIAASYVLCWSAKWFKQPETMFSSIKRATPQRMLSKVHKLLEQADVVVHYNGTSFDVPTLNKEFLTYGIMPPAPYKQIDLYLTARKQFRFPSNKLEYIARALKIGEKVKHEGHELWVKCMAGDDAAWKRMEAYNKGDVNLLEDVYLRMRPWVRNHPNLGVYTDGGGAQCPSCGSSRLMRRGYYRTQVNKYIRLCCSDCGSWSRESYGELDKHQRAALARPVPQN